MRAFILAVTGLAIGVTACGSYGTSVVAVSNPSHVASVSVALPASLVAGQTARAVATLKDQDGAVLIDRLVTWHTSSPSIVGVDDSGMIAAVAPGDATVSAVSEGVTGQRAMSVIPPTPTPIASLSVALTPSAVVVGQTAHATAVPADAMGNPLSGRTITWQSSNSGVAVVSAAGDVSAVAPGTTAIVATSEGKTASAALNVSAPAPIPVATVSVSPASSTLQVGATVQLSAVTRDANNNVLTGRVVAWSSVSAGIASVNSNGLVSAVSAGTTQITVSSEGMSTSATITVSAPAPVPVATVSVSPASSTLQVGATVQLSAVTRDANNNVLTGRVVTWSSVNAGIASVNSNGLVSAVSAGATQINVSSEGKSTSATITVSAPAPVPVATVSVSPSSSSLQVGATVQLTATTRDANNNVLTGRVVTWSSVSAGIASVNSNGLVSGVSAATTQITATSEGKSSSATITVTAPSSGGAVWRGNEPGGLTMVSDQPFNSMPSNSWRTEGGSIVSDPSAPQSPNNVFEINFPAGYGGGYSPGGADMDVNDSTLYFSVNVKYSLNWEGHPPEGINKIMHLWINGGNLCVISAEGQGSDPLYPAITFQSIIGGGNQGGGAFGMYTSPTPISRGVWHLIEVVATKNTSGQRNGSVYLYVDGVLVAQATGIQLTAAGNNWNMLQIAPIWGGTGGAVTNAQSLRLDHIYVSGR